MIILDKALKLRIQDSAIGALIDEFVFTRGKFPELNNLPDMLDELWENRDSLMEIFCRRNTPVPLADMIQAYPNFWEDLWENIQSEKCRRNKRPERTVS